MLSYVFRVAIEEQGEFWHASVPELEDRGATAWGGTRGEALENLTVILEALVEALSAEGSSLPPSVLSLEEPVVAINARHPDP